MDAETEAAIGALRERLDQIDARLERGRKEFNRIRWLLEGYQDEQAKHNDRIWDVKKERNMLLDGLHAELDALIAQVNLLTADLAALMKRMNDDAQRPKRTRKAARR
jgi:chromosome segregation ATPase